MVDAHDAFRRGRRLGGRVLDASAEASRRQAVERARRWRSRAFFIGQGAVAAGLAYSVARFVFDVPVPLFAPVAAIICLGMTYGQRFTRAFEITIGVAVGAFCGELFMLWFGLGIWQVMVIVGVAMSIATVLGAGTLMATQAGVQGLVVALLAGHTSTAFGRWFEALIGCITALVMASVVPSSALLRPRAGAVAMMQRLSGLLTDTARAVETGDRRLVEDTLRRARATEDDLESLRGHTSDAAEVTAVIPWYRTRRAEIRGIQQSLEPMDRAVRNARVLIRRAAVSLQVDEPVPSEYLDHVWELADATDALAHLLDTGEPDPPIEDLLIDLAQRSAQAAPGAELSAEVIRAQVRSILVDYFMMLGASNAEAQRAVREARLPEPPT